MRKRRYLYLTAIMAFLAFGGVASGATLFRDDFEGDTVGDAPGNFEMYDHPATAADFALEIAEDPADESGKVVYTFSYGFWIPKAAGRDEWSDFICEWDWMWANTGEFPGTAFRITGADYYHFSPRDDNVSLGFWYYNGAWNQVGALVQYDFQTNIWNRYQVIANGDELSIRIKRRDDPTPFSEIDPLLAVTDDNLEKGPLCVMGANTDAWVDNFIVGETEADMTFPVESMGKLASKWGAIKGQR